MDRINAGFEGLRNRLCTCMSLDDHIKKMEAATAALAQTQVEDSLLTTLDMIALVKLRLASEGKRADGSDFTDYNPIYAQKRQGRGLRTGFKDFNVTGRLYASIQPEIGANGGGKVEAFIIARGAENEVKVAGQIKRDGNILQPSQSEVREATLAHSRRRIQRANDLLNG